MVSPVWLTAPSSHSYRRPPLNIGGGLSATPMIVRRHADVVNLVSRFSNSDTFGLLGHRTFSGRCAGDGNPHTYPVRDNASRSGLFLPNGEPCPDRPPSFQLSWRRDLYYCSAGRAIIWHPVARRSKPSSSFTVLIGTFHQPVYDPFSRSRNIMALLDVVDNLEPGFRSGGVSDSWQPRLNRLLATTTILTTTIQLSLTASNFLLLSSTISN
jgi:hypothetical protein